ncbi:hypothetical protein [Arenibacter sp. S6351L]|uniref:hypothetical protein n=1 Tax=Arenibacter sp. S6351L TaxID=2926407 RepID=UPI001FF40446|nr:hypothetical protein [Arenibacter sp. S6351L]MCK0136059.1 hypothetical protein [Arenibacter sp. S6351L]
MPANPKYLTHSPWQRFAKITAVIIGGYTVTTVFHLVLASWMNRVDVIITSTFSSFILWAILMVVTFLAKKGWRIWGIYILVTMVLGVLMYLGKLINPTIV